MELIFIPEEIWLIIINYMDTSSFYNTIEALRGIYPELADKLMLYICNYVIREYPKIHLINHLYSNTNFFRIKKIIYNLEIFILIGIFIFLQNME